MTQSIMVACSDESSPLTVGCNNVTFRMPFAFNILYVRASVTSAPTGGPLIVDIEKNGTTILATRITIDNTEKSSTSAATPPVVGAPLLEDDSEISVCIDQIGATFAGAGLKVYIVGTRVP